MTRLALVLALGIVVLCACQKDPAGDDSGGGARGLAGASAVPAAGAQGNQAGAGASVAPPGGFGNSTVGGGGSITPIMPVEGPEGAECGATSVQAQQVIIQEVIEVPMEIVTEHVEVQPVALYIMLDQSASMDPQTLWNPAVSAIHYFAWDQASEGMDIALNYFPFPPDVPSDCMGAGFDTPDVPMGRLMPSPDRTQAQLITDSLQRHGPSTLTTPTEGALNGIVRYCRQFQIDHYPEKCVGVLVTDGLPALLCNTQTQALAQIAANAYNNDGIRIFTVGLQGADFNFLDAVAMAGGAPDCDPNGPRHACDVSQDASQLQVALELIRDTVVTTEVTTEITTEIVEHIQDTPLDCEWTIPMGTTAAAFDREKVNVQLTAPSLTDAIPFGKVNDPAACVQGAWHFDNNDVPTRIVACPQTCSMIQATPLAKVDILLGCETIILG